MRRLFKRHAPRVLSRALVKQRHLLGNRRLRSGHVSKLPERPNLVLISTPRARMLALIRIPTRATSSIIKVGPTSALPLSIDTLSVASEVNK